MARFGIALLVAWALCAAAPGAAAAQDREPLDVRVFARVPDPGQPEPIAIGPGRRVYVGTNQQGKGDADAASRIFVFSRRGKPLDDFALEGQDLAQEHGIQGLAFDGEGRLYALDRSAEPRVVRIDLQTGEQSDYASFRDVPSCLLSGLESDCSATVGDQPAAPNWASFAPDGSLYVTDIEQALIWRVPPGGGDAEVWFTDPQLENLFGPNGNQFMADGRTLLFAVSATGPVTGNPVSSALYKLEVLDDGGAGELELFWRSRPFDGADGFAIARSGNVYLALATANQVAVISPQGEELTRIPADPLANAQQEIPFDGPASVAFLGRRALVTNQSFPLGDPASWAVLDVYAGERGLPLFRPSIGR
jgi:sugar lactone lactonase YvrE